MVEERFVKLEFGEDWNDKRFANPLPSILIVNSNVGMKNDMLIFLMSVANGVGKSLEGLERRLPLVELCNVDECIVSSTFQPRLCRTPPPRCWDCSSRVKAGWGMISPLRIQF